MNPNDDSVVPQHPGPQATRTSSSSFGTSERRVRKKRRSKRRRRSITHRLRLGLPFVFPLCLGRVSYVLRMLFCGGILLFFLLIIGSSGLGFSTLSQSTAAQFTFGALGLSLIAFQLYVVAFVVAPRFHDAGLPRLLALLALVPFVKFLVYLAAILVPTGMTQSDQRS